MDNHEVVYFQMNNWFAGRDYPAEEPFLTWMKDDCKLLLCNGKFAKQNQLCVKVRIVDMAHVFMVTALKSWVEKTCPSLLTEHSRFLVQPDASGRYMGRFGMEAFEWKPSHVGTYWMDDYDSEEDEEDEEAVKA